MKTIKLSLLSLLIGCQQLRVTPNDLALCQCETLVIGDSISKGYQNYLPNSGHSQDSTSQNNAQTSAHTLLRIDTYVSQARGAKTILWNNGLWDLMRSSTSPYNHQTSLMNYEANLRAIAARLLNTGAKVYFLTTT